MSFTPRVNFFINAIVACALLLSPAVGGGGLVPAVSVGVRVAESSSGADADVADDETGEVIVDEASVLSTGTNTCWS